MDQRTGGPLKRAHSMVVGLGVLLSCSSEPPHWQTLPVQLVEAKHAYGLPANSIGLALNSQQSKWNRWVEKNCQDRDGDEAIAPPERLTEPLTVTVRPDSIQWMNTPAFAVPEESTTSPLMIRPLFDLATEAVEGRQWLREACGGSVRGLESWLVLVVADRTTPQRTIRRVLYSLGQARFSNFAMLVDDPAPEGSREDAPLGGFVEDGRDPYYEQVELYSGMVLLNDQSTLWQPDDGEAVTLPEAEPWPRSLGLPAPPTVAIVASPAAPVSAWLGAQDRLAGAQVYCALPASVPEGSGVSRDYVAGPQALAPLVPPRQPLRIRTHTTLPVHLVHLPGIGARVSVRLDGARCSQLRSE